MHPFVECVERELAIKKSDLSHLVKSGRMSKEVARKEYDRFARLVDFIRACEIRYDGEANYDPERPSPKATEAMASGDCEMRRLWTTQEDPNE